MYIKDLSCFEWTDYGKSVPELIMVGWLDEHHDFPKAMPDKEFLEKLYLIAKYKSPFAFHYIRGRRLCRLCKKLESYDHSIASGQLLIPSLRSGEYYHCPTLIYHYVNDHQYAPPPEFVDAVMEVDLNQKFCADDIYGNLMSKYFG